MKARITHTLCKIQKITVAVFCLAVLLTAVCPLTAFAAEPQTIRVGYLAFPGYHEVLESENGPQGSGYGFDFLQLLRRYTNLNYQYVGYEDSWLDMQQMLRDGQIDMVTSARKTSQREKKFAFSSPIQLEDCGMQVTRAADGEEVVEVFSNHPAGTFDIILMDIMMPKMNGYEATKAIRSLDDRPDGHAIPIIAMTANAFAEDVQASLDAGMNGHLSKPIAMDEVVKAIARNLSR